MQLIEAYLCCNGGFPGLLQQCHKFGGLNYHYSQSSAGQTPERKVWVGSSSLQTFQGRICHSPSCW